MAGDGRVVTDAPVLWPPRAGDRRPFGALRHGYLRFHRARLDPAVAELTWTRLADAGEQPRGLAAEQGGARWSPSRPACSTARPRAWGLICYREDLSVVPEARGQGVARRLIEAVFAAADAAGAASVHRRIQEYSAEGRALYATLARRTSFVVHQRGAAPAQPSAARTSVWRKSSPW